MNQWKLVANISNRRKARENDLIWKLIAGWVRWRETETQWGFNNNSSDGKSETTYRVEFELIYYDNNAFFYCIFS